MSSADVHRPHGHSAELDRYGNGQTSPGPDGHRHEVRAWRVMPDQNQGHDHSVLIKNADLERIVEALATPIGPTRSYHYAAAGSTKNEERPGGYVRPFAGLSVWVENPAGSTRSGTAADGTEWSVKMKNDYGFIRRAKGQDGEGLDVFLGPDEDAESAFVVHQNDPATGTYDEDKVTLGFRSADAAKRAYLSNYDRPEFFRSLTIIPMDQFRAMLTGAKPGNAHWKKKHGRDHETAAMFRQGGGVDRYVDEPWRDQARADDGTWAEGGGGRTRVPERGEHAAAGDEPSGGGAGGDDAERRSQMVRRGMDAMNRVIGEKVDVPNAMHRDDVGDVSFYWGEAGDASRGFKGGYGIAHILAKREAEGEDGPATARKIVEVIAKGKVIRRQNEATDGERAHVEHDGHTAVLSLYRFKGRETWLVTGWRNE